jgi:hypothetical protein
MKTNYNVLDVFFNSILFSNFKIENNIKLKKTDEKVLNISFHQSPNKVEQKSSINILKDKYGIESESCKTLKTPIITNKPTYYNKGYYFLSTDYEIINLNIVYENVYEIICKWSVDSLYKSFKKKNYNSKMKKEDLINKINNSQLGVKFNVSKIKDHGTLWKFLEQKTK